MCSIRIIKKVPDLAENFIHPATSLLREKHHGVLITGVQLCTDLCKISTEALEHIRKVIFYLSYNYVVNQLVYFTEPTLVLIEVKYSVLQCQIIYIYVHSSWILFVKSIHKFLNLLHDNVSDRNIA